MKDKKPRFVFWQPECLDKEELVIPVELNQHLERLNHIRLVDVPCIISTPAGIGISCGRIALNNCEVVVMFIVSHKPESRLNDKILFDLSELIIDRPEKLDMMIVRSPAILMKAIDNLITDDSLRCSIMPIMAQEYFETEAILDLKVSKKRHQKSVYPLNKVFNSHNKQNIKRFIRKK